MYETITDINQELVISPEQVKSYLRLSGNSEDQKIRSIILAATEWIERLTGRALLRQTRKLHFFKVKNEKIEISAKPLMEVVEVKIDGKLTNSYTRNGSILEFQDSILGKNVEITAEFGYGINPDNVPELLRHAVLMSSTYYYENSSFPPLDRIDPIINTFREIRI